MFARIRAAWRALWDSTTAPPALEPDRPERRISQAAMWEAERHNAPTFFPEQVFARPDPMPGVLPRGIALDYLPGLNQFGSAAYGQLVSEGLGFLGYPYLAELSQRAEYRKIVSIWAEHCTRKWIRLTGGKNDADARKKKLEEEFQRLDLKEQFRRAIEKEGFFGRVHLFMDFGDYRDDAELRTPLLIDGDKIKPARPLKRISIVEPMWSYPGIYDSQNPLAPDFYKPTQWYVSGRTVHASRLLTMVGHEMPNMLKPAYAFGGVSMTQLCKPYVDDFISNRQSASDLMDAFSTMVLATEMEQVLQGGGADGLFARVDLFNKTRNNRGTFVIDKSSEDFKNVSVPLSGVDKLVAQAQERMSSVSSIPLVVLLGITPSGLNASSEGEFRVFYDSILSYNERVCRPVLETLLDVLQLSLFGDIDQDLDFEFLPLWEMSDKDKADIRKSDAEAAGLYIDKGVVSPEEDRDRLNTEDGGNYNGKLSGPAPEPPDDGSGDEDYPDLVKADE